MFGLKQFKGDDGKELFERSEKSTEHKKSTILSVSANINWELFSPNPHIFSARELYEFETNAANFFFSSISASSSFEKQDIYVTNFDVKDQVVDVDRVQSSLEAKVTLTYGGHPLDNFAPLLETLFDSETLEPLLNTLSRQGMLADSTTTASINFSPGSPSSVISKGNVLMDTTLFIVLIAVSSILGLASLIILCKLGLCSFCFSRCKFRSGHVDNEIKITRTEETEESASPGVLGANNRHVSENDISFTPQRGIYNEYDIETPMSERSDATEISSASSSASVNPLGIVSMSKLRGLMYTPEKRQKNDDLYNMDIVNEE